MPTPRLLFSIVALALLTACSAAIAQTSAAPSTSNDASTAMKTSVDLGRDIINDPHKYLPKDVVADMSCAACHLNAGTVPHGGSFVGTYMRFPQWNKRSHRVIALQDRLAECFLYSMNGTPPAYNSKEMIAMVAYIASLSKGVTDPDAMQKQQTFIVPLPSASPDIAHGAKIYAQSCATCHGANGAGISGAIPPLWGSTSFNDGAGMAHIDRMTGFVHFNMPKNAPGSLSVEEAYDVAGWVLTHSRPKFDKSRVVTQQPELSSYF